MTNISDRLYGVLFIVLFIEKLEFSVSYLIFLLPIIPTIFNVLAFYLKEKKYYIGTIVAWGIFGLYCGFILVKYMINYLKPGKPYQLRPTTGHLLEYISLLLVLVINILIGILSPISVYRKSGNQQSNEYHLENPNNFENIVTAKATTPKDSQFELDLH
uniref:NADH dehydrogenase subunit 6 n=1 Tax=Panagrolaimus sp. PS1159 TaxID=55785 RepID=A0AC35EUL0_9BILA